MFTFWLLAVCLHFWPLFASPIPFGVEFSNKQDGLPILNLPYASYKAASYSSSSDIYTFKNIRYAAPPVGDLRWAKPAPPLNESTLQDGSYGPKCVQSAVTGLNLVGPGNNAPIGGAINQFLGGIPVPLFEGGQEDCLFLDVYVPGSALRDPSLKLPVAVWIYGGAYVFGSKDAFQPDLPMYDGSGMILNSGNKMIFVAMNYRLGAFGFLAGTTMEKEGLPNAGLWDQRAAFRWVKDHIHLVGGDGGAITAMGQSAGAGSIIHHLVGQGGKLDPLFSKAILQSPAYQWMWDRAGTVQEGFDQFASLAGCKGQGVPCLRKASPQALADANKALNDQVTPGSFAVGPTVDGSFIRQLPALELATGNFFKLDSAVVSHCSDESSLFVSGAVDSDQKFDAFLAATFSNHSIAAGAGKLIRGRYPSSAYATQSARVQAFLRDSCFTCHARHLTEAVGGAGRPVWNMQYSGTPGWHSTDLIPTFYNPKFSSDTLLGRLGSLFSPLIAAVIGGVSSGMQSYFTSYVTTGDPNRRRRLLNLPPTVQWDQPDVGGEQVGGVLNVGDWGFGTISDGEQPKSACDFWRSLAAGVTSLGGYAPPGAVVSQSLIQIEAPDDSSARYIGGNA
ncbi:hypothetical protein RB597_003474 [Gaeumannomyces tritici]